MPDQSFNERQRLVQAAVQEARGSSDLYIVELYDDRAIYESFGESPDAGKSFEVPYTIAADQTVTLGDRSEVIRETTYRAVKFSGPDTVEGLAIPYGGLFKGKDWDGESFTPNTDFCLDWFGGSGRPLLYHHGLDPAMKSAVIGRQVEYEERTEGIWASSQLDKSAKFRKAIDKLVDQGALGYSSGAMPHLATKNARREYTRWPWVELSLTPTASAMDLSTVHFVKTADVMAHLTEAKIDLPPALVAAAMKALDSLPSDDDALLDGAFLDRLDRFVVDGPDWVKARSTWHAKSGRVLSAATRERLAAHPDALRQLADDLAELLASADQPKEGKSADLWLEAIRTERALSRHLGLD